MIETREDRMLDTIIDDDEQSTQHNPPPKPLALYTVL